MPTENKPHTASSSALAHLDGLLDEALEQTFPASDAVAIDIERESHDREAGGADATLLRFSLARCIRGDPADLPVGKLKRSFPLREGRIMSLKTGS